MPRVTEGSRSPLARSAPARRAARSGTRTASVRRGPTAPTSALARGRSRPGGPGGGGGEEDEPTVDRRGGWGRGRRCGSEADRRGGRQRVPRVARVLEP